MAINGTWVSTYNEAINGCREAIKGYQQGPEGEIAMPVRG